ncbi:MAG: 2-oxo acid dehydrogenase subunit E2, partial [Sphingomonas sp.]|nr:2-oxo acid dehydrogenase subunit E2 [Sphingomonas sp.]
MTVHFKMPALSPTMEKGSIAKWLVKPGDVVKAGDLLVEIETDKATMEVEAVDEGILVEILIAEGTEDVPVGTPLARIGAERDALISPEPVRLAAAVEPAPAPVASAAVAQTMAPIMSPVGARSSKASPLARRLAAALGRDLSAIQGSGAAGKIVKADLGVAPLARAEAVPVPSASAKPVAAFDMSVQQAIPHSEVKLSGMRKTIARRLTESKQQVPHIYLTVDVRLDALLALRAELNASFVGRDIKLSVNDMLIKALALALIEVPQCN